MTTDNYDTSLVRYAVKTILVTQNLFRQDGSAWRVSINNLAGFNADQTYISQDQAVDAVVNAIRTQHERAAA